MSAINPPTPRLHITFPLAGLSPDTRLEVLGQEFHVHSLVLKMHSEYFRKFLDSPEKANWVPSQSGYRYEWVTKVDSDGTWSLIWKEAVRDDCAEITLKRNEHDEQIEAFGTLLKATYSQPFVLTSVAHLQAATKLADYYRVLSIFSLGVTSALFNSPNLVTAFPKSCCELLPSAAKLRNAVLFKECLIHSTCPFNQPRYLNLEEPKLKRIAEKAYRSIMKRIAIFQHEILTDFSGSYNPNNVTKIGIVLASTACDCPRSNYTTQLSDSRNSSRTRTTEMIILPQYYRMLYEKIAHGLPETYDTFLKPLLRSNLSLDRSGDVPGQAGQYKESFLCAEIDDEDLPWDITQSN